MLSSMLFFRELKNNFQKFFGTNVYSEFSLDEIYLAFDEHTRNSSIGKILLCPNSTISI